MKEELVWRLLGDLLDWTDDELVKQRRELGLMTAYKYDAYQGFQPGAHFYLALIGWLEQFPDRQSRKVAYAFIRDRLIFISQREMHHLVSRLMPIFKRRLHDRFSKRNQVPFFKTWIDEDSLQKIDLMLRRTLFVGLSDGAKVDVFRRYNEGLISNEQVVASNEISLEKWKDLGLELAVDISKRWPGNASATFETICLIDDFTGSGSSLIREKDGEWKGKVKRFISAIEKYKEELPIHFPCTIHIHHLVASEGARNNIQEDLQRFFSDYSEFVFDTSYSYELSQSIVIDDEDADCLLTQLLKEFYDADIEDGHTGKDIWYGYKKCGLPIVLEHNTPNNSIALLWATSNENTPAVHRMYPLFTRRKRHSSHG